MASVARLLDNDGLGGVFLLHGGDAFRRQEAVTQLVQAHLDEATRDFNLDVVRGTEIDVEQLASLLSTPPMMADFRVVHVKDAQGLAASSRVREVMLEVAAAPPPGLALVLDADISGSSAKFWKDLAKQARALEFASIRAEALPGVLMERARDVLGTTLADDAATALCSAIGGDLGILVQELDKLASVAGAGQPITLEVVEQAGIRLPAQDRWRWFDLVGDKRWDEAVEAVPVLLAQGENGVGLIMALGQLVLRMGVVQTAGPQALESALPPNQRWLVRKLAGQARRWSVEELSDGLAGLRDADRLLKSASLGDQVVLETWLLTRRAAAEWAAA